MRTNADILREGTGSDYGWMGNRPIGDWSQGGWFVSGATFGDYEALNETPTWWIGSDVNSGSIGPHGPSGHTSILPAVTRCTGLIVEPIIRTPWVVEDASGQHALPLWMRDPMLLGGSPGINGSFLPHGQRMIGHEFWSTVLTHAIWWGRGCFIFAHDSSGQPLAGTLRILNPYMIDKNKDGHWVIDPHGDTPIVTDDDGCWDMSGKEWCLAVVHGLPPIDDHTPSGVFTRHWDTLKIGAAVSKYVASTFASGVPSGYLRSLAPNTTQGEMDALKKKWMSTHGAGRREVAVLNATTEYQPIAISPVDADVDNVHQGALMDVAHAFGLSSAWLDVGGGSLCVDTETEILTRDGWRRYDEIAPGTVVLTLNHDTGLSEWKPLDKVNVFQVTDRAMVRMESRGHSSFSTDDHRWPVIRWTKRGYVRDWKISRDLNTKDSLIVAAHGADVPDFPTYPDSLVETAAWFFTEGWLHNRKTNRSAVAGLSQSERANPEKVSRIRRALSSLFEIRMAVPRGTKGQPNRVKHPIVVESAPSDGMVAWRLNPSATSRLAEVFDDLDGKVVSREFLYSLTQSQLDLFIDVAIDADGSRSGNSVSFKQHDPERMDRFMLACVLAGRPYGLHGTGLSLTMKKRSVVSPTQAAAEGRGAAFVRHERYTGTVWCPTVENRSWLARRNGTVYFTGNTYSNMVDRRRDLLDHTLTGWASQLMGVLSSLLPFGSEIRVVWTGYTAPNPTEQIPSLVQAVQAGLITLVEARSLLGLAPTQEPAPPAPMLPDGTLPPALAANQQALVDKVANPGGTNG